MTPQEHLAQLLIQWAARLVAVASIPADANATLQTALGTMGVMDVPRARAAARDLLEAVGLADGRPTLTPVPRVFADGVRRTSPTGRAA